MNLQIIMIELELEAWLKKNSNMWSYLIKFQLFYPMNLSQDFVPFNKQVDIDLFFDLDNLDFDWVFLCDEAGYYSLVIQNFSLWPRKNSFLLRYFMDFDIIFNSRMINWSLILYSILQT
jgi:hypothetical protein